MRVHDNVIRAPGDPAGPGNVPIDIEPNTGDTLRYVYVYNNRIDASEGAQDQFGTKTLAGIAVQGPNTTDFRDVFVHHNTVTGHTPNFDGYMISSGCILLRTARGVHVTDNDVSFCGYGGIVLDYQSNYNQILRNNITSSGFNPAVALLVDSSSNNEIKFNKISVDPREAAGLAAGEDTLILEQSVTAGTADNNDVEDNLADVALNGGGHSKNYLNTPPSSGATLIPNFTNAQHNHQNAAGGGQLTEAALSLSDVTTNNVSTTRHGFAPKAPNDTTKFLRGDGTWAVPSGGPASGWTDDGTVVRLTTSTDSVGIGTTTPGAKLQVTGSDVYVNTIGSGVILRSPNGSCFRLTVSDAGALSAAAISCP